MRSVIITVIASILIPTAVSLAQEGQSPVPGTRPLSEVKAALRAEAELIEKSGTSGRSLILADSEKREGLSSLQASLVGRLDRMTRTLLAAWLRRGLDDDPVPIDLVGRLTEKGAKERKAVITHADAIAAQLILTLGHETVGKEAEAAKQSQSRNVRPVRPQTQEPSFTQSATDVAKVIAFVKDEIDKLDRGKISFGFAVLDRPAIRAVVKLSKEQSDLFLQFDETVRAILSTWMLRGLEIEPLPADLADRVIRRRDATIAHAHAILYQAILSPRQAELFKRTYWATRGVPALLEDPELASRLRLTKEQKALIAELLTMKTTHAGRLQQTHGHLLWDRNQEVGQQAYNDMQRSLSEFDLGLWEILSPTQMSKLGQLLGSEIRPPLRREKRSGQSQRNNPGDQHTQPGRKDRGLESSP
ncbi:hypothetical protein SAMN05444166_1902 [Singulisphaera sp. GP187]|uniref:hypothetical protein n=1 Tax=Singulisphaera sp. GP187 TaxID=1882752 RepID=UPI00092681B7|nr:hypothetical protein [Singulisphaera sp. GP187]SIN98306.1 hypothetical protein SAMN05444166_1902 [Singulisphaera sp. GP187]